MRIDGPITPQFQLRLARVSGARAYGPPAPTAPAVSAAPTSGVRDLVAARVSGPVEFGAAARPDGALTLYTRAADRIEAGVRLGRAVDLTG